MAVGALALARDMKETAIHEMYSKTVAIWKVNRVERQRWKGHRCPSCSVLMLLNKWHISESVVHWPAHLSWLEGCHCEVDESDGGADGGAPRGARGGISETDVYGARKWADAVRGLHFGDIFGVAYRCFHTNASPDPMRPLQQGERERVKLMIVVVYWV
jgi:hypothetical protein